MSRFINPIPQFILANGDIDSGGQLFFYEYNTDTLMELYGDENESITIPNPVTLGERGQVPNIFFSTTARVKYVDSNGDQKFDVQPVTPGGAGAGGVQAWSTNSTYSQLAIVFASDSGFYISNVNDNTGNDPVDDTDDSPYWTRLNLFKWWNAQESYGTGAIVLRGVKLYSSNIDENVGNDPNTDSSNWTDLVDSRVSPYNNTISGLTSTTVKTAIDELVAIIDAITQPLLYKGVLDVSTGDAALPGGPANGDLYIIGVGGTITVSVNGGAAAATAVTVGQQIVYNGTETRWDLVPFSQIAASISYNNATSGLVATDVQSAIDEVDATVDSHTVSIAGINATLAGLGSGVAYRGVLDVSSGDSALPLGPSGGDLYGISVGGTITVSVNGAAPAATAVTAGQQIIYNGFLVQWDLLSSLTEAGEISYDNSTSGLSAVNVQTAIDEIDATVDTLVARDNVDFSTVDATGTITRQGTLTDVTKDNTANVTFTLSDATFQAEDIVRIRKIRETGTMTVQTTNNQVTPTGVTDTESQFPDGIAGTVELKFDGSQWALRVF